MNRSACDRLHSTNRDFVRRYRFREDRTVRAYRVLMVVWGWGVRNFWRDLRGFSMVRRPSFFLAVLIFWIVSFRDFVISEIDDGKKT